MGRGCLIGTATHATFDHIFVSRGLNSTDPRLKQTTILLNARLNDKFHLFQLREKDDANLKLMSERIKSNQIQRLAREERDMLIQQVNTLSTQVSYMIWTS